MMVSTVMEKANELIVEQGMERAVQVLALIGAYTTGKLIVKGGRKLYNMATSKEDE